MKRSIDLMLEEYIHLVWNMFSLCEDGIGALYGLEQHRINLHDQICEALGINREKSKNILSCLDSAIELDMSICPEEADLKRYAQKLYQLLKKEKEAGNL